MAVTDGNLGMDFEPLKSLLSRKSQYIDCAAAGQGESERYRASITHRTGAPDRNAAASLQDMKAEGHHFEDLFALYGKIELYCDAHSDAAGFAIANPADWSALKSDIDDWLEDVPDNLRSTIIPDWYDGAIAFASAPYSPDHFVMALTGRHRGEVFRFDHEALGFAAFAGSLDAFLRRVCTPDGDLMEFMADYLRLSDGISDSQWYPLAYNFDG